VRTRSRSRTRSLPSERHEPLVPASVRYRETLERRKRIARAFVDPEAPRTSFVQKLRLIGLYEWFISEIFAYVIKTIRRRAAEGTLTRAHIKAVRTFLKEAAALKAKEGKA
jgi:hypothetical protein